MIVENLPGIFVTAYKLTFDRLIHSKEAAIGVSVLDIPNSFACSGLRMKGNTRRSNLIAISEYIDYLLKNPASITSLEEMIICNCEIEFCPNYAYLLFSKGMLEELTQWGFHLNDLVRKSEYRFFITGSRDLFIKKEIKKVLADLYAKGINPKKMVMVVGDAKGVDATAAKLWQEAGLRIEVFKADWDQYGKKAGMLRNILMLKSGVDYGYGFCKNNSRGTTGMLKAANELGVPFERFDFS
jgi:hypothetical protein